MAEEALLELVQAIAAGDGARAGGLLAAEPSLATAAASAGASRAAAAPYFFASIGHHLYAGDTALHMAAAAHQPRMVTALLAAGADVGARNRRGASPLHYAADGAPGSPRWYPEGQRATIARLLAAGADPNAVTKEGATPLHRAVRTRSAAAVAELLQGGADPGLRTGRGSTAARLAEVTSGKGGSGSPAARAQQAEIQALLAGQPG